MSGARSSAATADSVSDAYEYECQYVSDGMPNDYWRQEEQQSRRDDHSQDKQTVQRQQRHTK